VKLFKNKNMRLITILVFFLASATPCLGEGVEVWQTHVAFKADKVFLGKDVNIIETVFNKYLAIVSNPLDKALLNKKYYKFSFKGTEKTTIVRVSFNHELVQQELNMRIKGGGGEFIIDNKSNTITSFSLSK
jgi:hypothetical protein